MAQLLFAEFTSMRLEVSHAYLAGHEGHGDGAESQREPDQLVVGEQGVHGDHVEHHIAEIGSQADNVEQHVA